MEQPGLPLTTPADSSKWVVSVEDVIGELAKRHGVRVRRDDPTLVIIRAFELVAKAMQSKFAAACERANDDTSAAMLELLDSSKAIGEQHIEAAAGYVAQRMRDEARELAPLLAADVRRMLEKIGAELGAAREATQRAERRAWTAAVVSGLAAIVTIAATVGVVAGRAIG